jgi:hypothetical protein
LIWIFGRVDTVRISSSSWLGLNVWVTWAAAHRRSLTRPLAAHHLQFNAFLLSATQQKLNILLLYIHPCTPNLFFIIQHIHACNGLFSDPSKLSTSWGDSCSAGQEITYLLWSQKDQYCFHSSLPPNYIVSQSHHQNLFLFDPFQCYFLKYPKWSLPFGFSN